LRHEDKAACESDPMLFAGKREAAVEVCHEVKWIANDDKNYC